MATHHPESVSPGTLNPAARTWLIVAVAFSLGVLLVLIWAGAAHPRPDSLANLYLRHTRGHAMALHWLLAWLLAAFAALVLSAGLGLLGLDLRARCRHSRRV
jgi:hypothetical protein